MKSLPARLAAALAAGILLSLCAPSWLLAAAAAARQTLGQFITFCAPLIAIGFIAPSIAGFGANAPRTVAAAFGMAYASSVCAALAASAAGYLLIPGLKAVSAAVSETRSAAALCVNIPQIMPVMSALAFSILLGVFAARTRAETVCRVLGEFRQIAVQIVARAVIPILPLFIASVFASGAAGAAVSGLSAFVGLIFIIIAGQFVWLAVLYGAAGMYSGRNPLDVLRHYGPAWLAAAGTMSSAAALPTALEGARRSCALHPGIVDFGVPLFTNIHPCGSVVTEIFAVMAVSRMLRGSLPAPGTMIAFCLLLGAFVTGAPGVPGGTVMASLGLLVSLLGFDETGVALMLTIFALQDSFSTAANVTGNGALTLMLSAYAEKRGLAEARRQK